MAVNVHYTGLKVCIDRVLTCRHNNLVMASETLNLLAVQRR